MAHRPRDWPLVFAVDGSTMECCDAETNPRQGFYYPPVPALRWTADRGRVVVSVDLPTEHGCRFLERAERHHSLTVPLRAPDLL